MLWNEAVQIYNSKKMANGLKKSRLKRNLQNFVDPNSFIGIYLQEVFKPFQRKEICLLDKLTKGGIDLENVSDKLAFTATIVKLSA